LRIIGDSQLVVKQVNGTFKAKNKKLMDHRDCVLRLLEYFSEYSIKWVPRNQNKEADALVNQVFKARKQRCQTRKKKK